MKKFILRNLTIGIILLAVSASAFAYFAGVEGKYKGTANVEGLGTFDITAELKGPDDKLTGTIDSPHGQATITEGNAKDGKIMFRFTIGDVDAVVDGTIDDTGKISGTIASDQANGTLEMIPVKE